jgi:hypothetical protein
MITAAVARQTLIDAHRSTIFKIEECIAEAAKTSRSVSVKLDSSIEQHAAESIANVFSSEPCNFTVTVDYDLDNADEFVCYVLRIYW